jgi:hypothetical protein
MNLVDIACAERGIEDELMLARASHEQVVTTFDPILIAKYQRRFPDLDDKIISMYTWHDGARDPRTSGGALRH